ncbi:histidine kinase [Streptomyces xinghaiensis]|nr:histidine kinase [Streptomyces xinghaiensis]
MSAAGMEALGDGGGPRAAATALAVAVLSLLRRALPATVLVVTAAGSGMVDGFALLLMVAGWSAGRRITGAGRALAAFAAALVLNSGLGVLREYPGFGAELPALIVFSAAFFLATTVVPGLASRHWWQRRTLLHTLREHNAHLLRERAMVVRQARLRERQRIAQDMHDSLGHQLALIAVHTGALEVDRELTGRQREAVGVLREASVAAMHELREAVGILRDGTEGPEPAGDARPAARGVAGVEGLVEASRSAGTPVELVRSGEPRDLPPAAGHAAYRIAQEGLTNAHKHAPGAPITVQLRYEPDSLVVEVANGPAAVPVPRSASVAAAVGAVAVADGGRGDGAAGGAALRVAVPVGSEVSGGQGLPGLRERARLVGGMVHAGPVDGGGFRLAGVLPYGPEQGGARERPGSAGEGRSGVVGAYGAEGAAQIPGAHGPGGGADGWPGATGATGATGADVLPAPDSVYGDAPDPWAYRPQSGSGAVTDGRSGGVATGCGIAVLVLLVVVALLGWGAVTLFRSMEASMITPEVYQSVRVGDSEAEVREKLPEGRSWLTDGLAEQGPPRPEGSRCLALLSTETSADWYVDPAFRFCFRDGKLVQKRSYDGRL